MFAGKTWRKWSATIHLSRLTLLGILLYVRSRTLNRLWMLSAPCSPITPRPTLHCHHMVFEHVEFAHDRCFRESSTIVPDELVDVVKYMYGYNCAGVGSSQEASPLFDLPTPAQLKPARMGKAWNVEPSVRMSSRLGM